MAAWHRRRVIPEPTAPALTGAELKARQDRPDGLRLLLAMRRATRRGKQIRRLRVGGSLAVALAGPLLTTLKVISSDTVGAIAGGWVVLALLLAPLERRLRDQGVRLSEQFDCYTFGLPWEISHGRPVPPERVADLSQRLNEAVGQEKLTGWYVVDDALPGELAVLLCQRQACVYSQRLHLAYLWFTAAASAVAAIALLVLFVTQDLDLGEFLVGFALPALAGVVVVDELVRAHLAAWNTRKDFEAALYEQAASGAVTWEQLRRHQDTQFRVRGLAPPLPEWLYKAARDKNEAAMAYAAEEFAAALRRMADGHS